MYFISGNAEETGASADCQEQWYSRGLSFRQGRVGFKDLGLLAYDGGVLSRQTERETKDRHEELLSHLFQILSLQHMRGRSAGAIETLATGDRLAGKIESMAM